MLLCIDPSCPSNTRGFGRPCDQSRHINTCSYAQGFLALQQKRTQQRKLDCSELTGPRPAKRRRVADETICLDDVIPVMSADNELADVNELAAEDTAIVEVSSSQASSLPRRARKRPRPVFDVHPEPIIAEIDDAIEEIGRHSRDSGLLPRRPTPARLGQEIWTLPNTFGIRRRYFAKPSSIPDGEKLASDLVVNQEEDESVTAVAPNVSTSPVNRQETTGPVHSSNEPLSASETLANILTIIAPHPHISSFLLNRWFYRAGSINKSKIDRNLLVKDVLLNPAFDVTDLAAPFSFNALDDKLANTRPNDISSELPGTGWKRQDIVIDIPPSGIHPRTSWSTSGAYTRDIVSVACEVVESSLSRKFNWDGFEEFWQPEDATQPLQRIYHNTYSSDAFLQAEAELRRTEPQGYEGPPRRVLGLMFWSDATHLSDFGQASLHPVYMGFSNQDKYERVRPSKRGLHHVAYIPKLPNELIEFMTLRLGKPPSSELITHLRQEHFHAVWRLLLNERLVTVHKDGIVLACGDGLTRHIFIRIMTYSTDYPERAAVACIRPLGRHSCPLDLAGKQHLDLLGTPKSRQIISKQQRIDNGAHRKRVEGARALIYDSGLGIRSAEVERRLSKMSLTPTLSAFSDKLGHLDPPVSSYKMLVNDVMHEWEGGVVKRTIGFLVRLVHAADGNFPALLDRRYREMPSFGSRLRRFPPNFSELKNLAARDHENALLCSVNAFSGLLTLVKPDLLALQDAILDALYTMSTFHSLAKLRMHTTATLEMMKDVTMEMGVALRRLRDESKNRITVLELSRDVQARARNQARKVQKEASAAPATQKKVLVLNLDTIKNHLLEHYPDCVTSFGTTDGYSTSLGEREHCLSKSRFQRTNKQRDRFVASLTKEETIERRIMEMENEITQFQEHGSNKSSDFSTEIEKRVETAATMMRRYTIGSRSDNAIILPNWLEEHDKDPAVKVFMRKLNDHILRRLRQGHERLDDDTRYSALDHSGLIIRGDRIYEHKTIQINYTTYDLRREHDSITSQHPNIMLLSNEDPDPTQQNPVHPFWYARVLKIFHVFVYDTQRGVNREERMDILWVRWFGEVTDWSGGWSTKRMLRVGYAVGSEDGFGFVDPSEVLRGCYLLPVREFDHTCDLLDPPSKLASDSSLLGDYRYYDIIHWVDRDMFMRYCGGGPGHFRIPTCRTAWSPAPAPAPAPNHAAGVSNEAPAEDAMSNSSGSEDDAGSDYCPDALDLLIDEELIEHLEYGL